MDEQKIAAELLHTQKRIAAALEELVMLAGSIGETDEEWEPTATEYDEV